MGPIVRFTDAGGRARLVEALRTQYIVHGNEALATALAGVCHLSQHPPGSRIIDQGGADTDIYFILLGEVSIVIGGREMLRRPAGQHVGEMSLIDVSQPRMATVMARDTVVIARVSEPDFSALAARDVQLWRRIAMRLADRLRERTQFIRPKNETPILFVGSSSESLPVVRALEENLSAEPFTVRPWTRGVFAASQFPIDDLVKQVNECDFAALVLGPDDLVHSRWRFSRAPRDNVVFELGLFMGVLERSRTLFVIPGKAKVKLPSDITGVTPLHFDPKVRDLAAALDDASREIASLVLRHGAR
jgi:predicted nucleotide-binding protein